MVGGVGVSYQLTGDTWDLVSEQVQMRAMASKCRSLLAGENPRHTTARRRWCRVGWSWILEPLLSHRPGPESAYPDVWGFPAMGIRRHGHPWCYGVSQRHQRIPVGGRWRDRTADLCRV